MSTHPKQAAADAPAARPPSASPSLWRHLSERSFMVVAAILLVCAVGLNATVSALKLSFQKKPVELSVYGKELTHIPMDLGPWKMISQDDRLNEDIEHALGTKQYVFRDYVDERVIGAQEVARLREMDSLEERYRALYELQYRHRKVLLMRLAVTYYTGMVDTVAHIPDRCYIADGYEPSYYVDKEWPTEPQPTKARFITFEDQTGRGKETRNVAYFFFVNGRQVSSPIDVRVILQNLAERYGYYSKVEMMVGDADAESAEAAMRDFLTHALPQIVACLPDWEKVKASEQAER